MNLLFCLTNNVCTLVVKNGNRKSCCWMYFSRLQCVSTRGDLRVRIGLVEKRWVSLDVGECVCIVVYSGT